MEAAEAADLVEAASAAEALAAVVAASAEAEGALVARTSIIMVRISTADGSSARGITTMAAVALADFSA